MRRPLPFSPPAAPPLLPVPRPHTPSPSPRMRMRMRRAAPSPSPRRRPLHFFPRSGGGPSLSLSRRWRPPPSSLGGRTDLARGPPLPARRHPPPSISRRRSSTASTRSGPDARPSSPGVAAPSPLPFPAALLHRLHQIRPRRGRIRRRWRMGRPDPAPPRGDGSGARPSFPGAAAPSPLPFPAADLPAALLHRLHQIRPRRGGGLGVVAARRGEDVLAGGGGTPACGRGGHTGRPAGWLPGWRGRADATGLVARAGWLAWADVAAADGVHGGGQARAKAGEAASLAALLGEQRLLGHAGRGGGYTWLCRAMDHGAAEPCHVSGQRL
ncbi:vegetative cell wall protein gp1-like [Miscanthus floridulus]|uniref:vegetative cell wall protein gp1-like n=1 Tax=Miscanthus floridulus TaxID=154761 RepID=UPI00345809A6